MLGVSCLEKSHLWPILGRDILLSGFEYMVDVGQMLINNNLIENGFGTNKCNA